DTRLEWRAVFSGWNAGSDVRAIQNGQPESWPTGVVHMFLYRLRHSLSIQIKEQVLRKYGERVQRFDEPSRRTWDAYLDCDLPGIYDSVNDVFTDLADLFGVVILFDEMDALVQSRESDESKTSGLDVTQKLLTTSMLPKLLKLRKTGRALFFMATNHQSQFDP